MLVLLVYLALVGAASAGCAALAAVSARARPRALAVGRGALILCVLAVSFLAVATRWDWTHLLWSVLYGTLAVFAGVGLVLVRDGSGPVWPGVRLVPARWLVVGLLALGFLPAGCANALGKPFPGGRESGSLSAALVEVVAYGFGGDVPRLMEPRVPEQLARGLGSPPRFVSVGMGASLWTAWAVVGVAFVVLLGRAARRPELRRAVVLLLPPALGVLGFTQLRRFEDAVWTNEPWLVRSYGPTLLGALAASGVIFLMTRERPEPT